MTQGRCRFHRRLYERQIARAGKGFYGTKRWRLLRRQVLFDQPLCDCGMLAVDVDHVIPIAAGGLVWDRANLRGMCKACHSQKTRLEQQYG